MPLIDPGPFEIVKLHLLSVIRINKLHHDKMACAASRDSNQPGNLPSLIRVFAVCMKKAWVLSYPLSAQLRLWSDWTDAQADLSFCWAHSHFVGFVVRRLKCSMQLPGTGFRKFDLHLITLIIRDTGQFRAGLVCPISLELENECH